MIHILGSGGIGCNLAAKLQRPISLICRTMPTGVPKLTYELPNGSLKSIEDINFQSAKTVTPISKLIVCTKAGSDTYNAVNSIKHFITKDSSVLFLQNGYRQNEELLNDTKLEKHAQILNSMITFGGFLRQKFHVVDAGSGLLRASTRLEEAFNTNTHELIDALKKTDYTIDIVPPHELDNTLKTKIAVNCVVNMLGALLKSTSGELFIKSFASDDQILPSNENLIHNILKEVCQVLDLDLESTAELTRKASLATYTNFNSTARDYHVEGKRMSQTEIKYITGYLIEEGKSKGIPTPVNQTLYDLFAMMSKLREHKCGK